MNKILYSLVLVFVFAAVALPSAEARRVNKQEYTPEQLRDFKCQESNLSPYKETTEAWAQYQKECAVRPASMKKFQDVLAEYLKPRRKYNDKIDTDYEIDSIISGLLERTYLSLYELERQKVFADKITADQMRRVVRKCPQSKHGLRRTYSRCFVFNHTGVDTAGGNPEIIAAYIASLEKRGLWIAE